MEMTDNITIPPPLVKEMIHKTADYVHRNGIEFETRIRDNESNNSKFQFLNENDPYHEYYKHVLAHIDEYQKNDLKDSGEEPQSSISKPAHDLDFIINLPAITSKDLEIIKLTALFIAKNGENYINQIKTKYNDMIVQFSFLNDTHSFHKLFLSYLKQYRKILDKNFEVEDYDLLKEAYDLAKFKESNKIKDAKIKEMEENKRMKYALIDWQDFVVVETIEFTDLDKYSELETPLILTDLQYRSLEQKTEDVKDSKMKIKSYGETRLTTVGDNGNNNNNNNSKLSNERLVECPITGKLIPESKFEKHISIILRDPKYKQEKLNYESKIKNTNLSTDQVVENIKSLFNPKAKVNKKAKLQWDGYNSSVDIMKQQGESLRTQDEEELKRKQSLNTIGPRPQ